MRMRNLIKYISQVNDFRDGFNLKHKLVDILTIAVLAVLSGVETWDDMELYGKERHSLLKKFLELPAGIPSHDTFNRVFSLLNKLEFIEISTQTLGHVWHKAAFVWSPKRLAFPVCRSHKVFIPHEQDYNAAQNLAEARTLRWST